MSEERADESGAARHLGELRSDEIGQTLTLLQWPACMTGALRMVPPDQLIGVEIRGVARQVMEGLIAVEPCNVSLTTPGQILRSCPVYIRGAGQSARP